MWRRRRVLDGLDGLEGFDGLDGLRGPVGVASAPRPPPTCDTGNMTEAPALNGAARSPQRPPPPLPPPPSLPNCSGATHHAHRAGGRLKFFKGEYPHATPTVTLTPRSPVSLCAFQTESSSWSWRGRRTRGCPCPRRRTGLPRRPTRPSRRPRPSLEPHSPPGTRTIRQRPFRLIIASNVHPHSAVCIITSILQIDQQT